MIKSITLKFVYIFILVSLLISLANSENKIKIELQIENEILTNVDFLNERNYHIDTCTNGNDALDMISCQTYEIILLDENMPGLSGIETLKKIKKIDRNLKVIMITKSEEENIMEQAIGREIFKNS